MATLRITISRSRTRATRVKDARELIVVADSSKRLTKGRIARILADRCPGFRRRKGRYSTFAGKELLPVLEETECGWRAWRLSTGNSRPSGFEPPLKGRVGRSNSRGNALSDRAAGNWEQADIAIVEDGVEKRSRNTSRERTRDR